MTSPDHHAGSTSIIHLEVDGSDYFTGVKVRAKVSHVQTYMYP